jgi:hypothetical protein
MLRDPNEVRKELYKRVLLGYNPSQNMESAEDHNADWSILPLDEFEHIKQNAIKDRVRRSSGTTSHRLPHTS